MRDIDIFVAMIEKFGIPFKRLENPSGVEITIDRYGTDREGRIPGYTDFVQAWYFNSDGKFIGAGAWE